MIHAMRQLFEDSSPPGHFLEKRKKKTFFDMVNGSVCTKFKVCIVFRLARRRDTKKYIHTQTHTYTSEFKNILGGCSPHVDFEVGVLPVIWCWRGG